MKSRLLYDDGFMISLVELGFAIRERIFNIPTCRPVVNCLLCSQSRVYPVHNIYMCYASSIMFIKDRNLKDGIFPIWTKTSVTLQLRFQKYPLHEDIWTLFIYRTRHLLVRARKNLQSYICKDRCLLISNRLIFGGFTVVLLPAEQSAKCQVKAVTFYWRQIPCMILR